MTHYELLGVPVSALSPEIQAAFRRAASLYHPDRPGGGDEEKMKALNVAYACLMDREQRAKYDATLPTPGTAVILACVSESDYEGAKRIVERYAGGMIEPGKRCGFCDGAQRVRVQSHGFWQTKACPVCSQEGS